MTIKDMIEKRAKVWETAKNFVDTHENENGVLSAEDNATYSRMEQEIEDLTAAIDRQQRAEAREAEFNKPVNMPLTGRPARQEVEKRPVAPPMRTRKTSVRILEERDWFIMSFPKAFRRTADTLFRKSLSVRSYPVLMRRTW